MNTEDTKTFPEIIDSKKQNIAYFTFLPSRFFYSELITTTPTDIHSQILLRLESSSPLPIESLLYGRVTDLLSNKTLLYATSKDRVVNYINNSPKSVQYILPLFSLWKGENNLSQWVWFSINDELTALCFTGESVYASKVLSWELPESLINSKNFSTDLLEFREYCKKHIPASELSHRDGIYLIGNQLKKEEEIIISLNRIQENAEIVPAAKTLVVSLKDESLWLADVREPSSLKKIKKDRKQAMILSQLLSMGFVFFIFLIVVKFIFWGLLFWNSFAIDKQEQQVPIVEDIKAKDALSSKISQIMANRLNLFQVVVVLNSCRPDGLSFTNFNGDGEKGEFSILGQANSILDANNFEKAVRSSGYFKDIVFSANIGSRGANWTLKCIPLKQKISEIDFYAKDDVKNESENKEKSDLNKSNEEEKVSANGHENVEDDDLDEKLPVEE